MTDSQAINILNKLARAAYQDGQADALDTLEERVEIAARGIEDLLKDARRDELVRLFGEPRASWEDSPKIMGVTRRDFVNRLEELSK